MEPATTPPIEMLHIWETFSPAMRMTAWESIGENSKRDLILAQINRRDMLAGKIQRN